MSRFGSLCILLLTALLMLLTVMACSEEDSAPLTPCDCAILGRRLHPRPQRQSRPPRQV